MTDKKKLKCRDCGKNLSNENEDNIRTLLKEYPDSKCQLSLYSPLCVECLRKRIKINQLYI